MEAPVKLVVYYETGGGYECGSYEHILCCLYASPEAFLCDFQIALEEAKKKLDATSIMLRNFWVKTNRGEKAEFVQPEYGFSFAELIWNIEDFYDNGEVELPEVYGLEEWFEYRIKEQ